MQYDDKLITLDNLGTFKGKMEGEIDKASHDLIADGYDATKTYNVGDVVLHDGFLYECNTAIGTAEEWDPTKWTQVKVTELNSEDEFEVYTGTVSKYVTLTAEQIKKAKEGKFVIRYQDHLLVASSGYVDGGDYIILFEAYYLKSENDVNVPQILAYTRAYVQLNCTTGKFLDVIRLGYSLAAVNHVSSNFMDATTVPSSNDTRIIRSLNLRKMQDMIADVYDATTTYAVGDVVIYQNDLYECNTAIETAEEWNASHWTQVKVTELGGEDEIEFLLSLTSVGGVITTVLTESQIRKAREGKLYIRYNGDEWFRFDHEASNVLYFYYEGIGNKNDIQVPRVVERYKKSLNYDLVNNRFTYSTIGNSTYGVTAVSDNFFSSDVDPVASGKRLVREMNVAGKLIPTYSSADANKVVKINAAGDGVVLADDEVGNDIEVVEYQTTTPLTDEQVAKAQAGRLFVRYKPSVGDERTFIMAPYYIKSNTITFVQTMNKDSSSALDGSNFLKIGRYDWAHCTLTLTTKLLSDFNNNGGNFVTDVLRNVFDQNTDPDVDGKQIVRALNLRKTQDMIANVYDATATYSVGDYAIYQNDLYRCKTAIETAEAFDSTKWDKVQVAELNNEDEVEVVAHGDGKIISEEQLKKAKEGKLIISSTALGSSNPIYMTVWNVDDQRVYFHCSTPYSEAGNNVEKQMKDKSPHCSVQFSTRSMSTIAYGGWSGVSDSADNFFESNVAPTSSGKKIVREQNIYGKIIPTYSSSDAGKVVKINSSGTGIELDDINVETATELEINRLFRTEYAITATITNGSASGDTSIWTKETASVTIVPSSGYVLPETVAVSGATYAYDGSTGVVSLSAATGAVTISGECTPTIIPPNKGDIITLDGGTARYRVLKTNGNVAEVIALDDVADSAFNSSSVTTTFSDGWVGQKYENSTLDNYMNSTFYNSLSVNIKAAIVQKAITQSIYQLDSSEISGYDFAISRVTSGAYTHWYKRKGQVSVGNRYCYALDLDDVAEYLGAGSGNTVLGADLNDMFFEQTTAVSKYVWLSSAVSGNTSNAFNVRGYEGLCSINSYKSSYVVRPAFQVDLSKVTWTKEFPVPEKGDIITLDGGTARYRVLKTDGNVAEVLALDDVASSAFNSSGGTTTFSDGSVGQKYENSTLDNYMNSTFYNSLSANIKAAIVQKAVTQSIYQFGSSEISGYDFTIIRITARTRWYKRKGEVSVGNRYCYAPDLDDVAEYLEAGSGNTVSGADLNDMFFEQTTAISKYVWLDSADSDNSDNAFRVDGSDGYISRNFYTTSTIARPAFQVDLSKVSWSKE